MILPPRPRTVPRRAVILIAAALLSLGAAVFLAPVATNAGTSPPAAAGVLERTADRVGERSDSHGIDGDVADLGTGRVRVEVVETAVTEACEECVAMASIGSTPGPPSADTATADVGSSGQNTAVPFALVVIVLITFLAALWWTNLRR